MSIKTADQINSEIIALLQILRPDADVSTGSLISDIVSNSPSTSMSLVYLLLQNIGYGQSITFISNMSDTQIELLASNWLLTRKIATTAAGYITFFRRTAPPSTITINAGTTITSQKSSSGITYSFVTTQIATISNSSYNVSTGLWESTVAIQAVLAGSASNVGVGVINIASGVSGIDGCTNRIAITNAIDDETNLQLATRIVTAAQARLIGTVPGYENLINSIDGVTASKVVTPGDPDAFRSENGNECSIFVMGDILTSTTQVEIFDSANGLSIFLDSTPVDSVAGIQGLSNTFIEGTDFQFVPDTYSDYKGSNQSYDKVMWLNGGNKPSQGESYTISYSYNELITILQDLIELPENTLIASDILVASAVKILVDISLSVAVTSSAPSDAVAQIETAIETYMAGMTLGTPLQQSDLDYYLRSTLSWLDRLILPFTALRIRGGTGTQDLVATKYQYFAIDQNSLNITVI